MLFITLFYFKHYKQASVSDFFKLFAWNFFNFVSFKNVIIANYYNNQHFDILIPYNFLQDFPN